ncbi:hypothetical protein WME94_46150 [Sorangium sp. So ce429]
MNRQRLPQRACEHVNRVSLPKALRQVHPRYSRRNRKRLVRGSVEVPREDALRRERAGLLRVLLHP